MPNSIGAPASYEAAMNDGGNTISTGSTSGSSRPLTFTSSHPDISGTVFTVGSGEVVSLAGFDVVYICEPSKQPDDLIIRRTRGSNAYLQVTQRSQHASEGLGLVANNPSWSQTDSITIQRASYDAQQPIALISLYAPAEKLGSEENEANHCNALTRQLHVPFARCSSWMGSFRSPEHRLHALESQFLRASRESSLTASNTL